MPAFWRPSFMNDQAGQPLFAQTGNDPQLPLGCSNCWRQKPSRRPLAGDPVLLMRGGCAAVAAVHFQTTNAFLR